MKLREYLLQEGLTQWAFGQMLTPAVSQGKVNHWLQETRRVSLVEALQVQRLTGGAVSVEDQVSEPCQDAKISMAQGAGVQNLLTQADSLSLVERRVSPLDLRLVQQPFSGPEKHMGLDIGNAGQGV